MKNIILFIVLCLAFNTYSQNIEIVPNQVYRTEFTFFESPLVFENGKVENHSGNKFLWEDAFNVFYNPYYFDSVEESISYSKNMNQESYLAFKNRMTLAQVQNLNPIYILGFYELLFTQSSSKVLVLIRASIFNEEKVGDVDFRKAFQSNGSSGTNFFIYDSQKQKYLNYSVDDFFNLSSSYMSMPEFNNFLIGTSRGLEQCYLKEGAKIIKNHNPSIIEDKRLNGGSKLRKSELLPWLKDCVSDSDGDGIKNCEDDQPNTALPFSLFSASSRSSSGAGSVSTISISLEFSSVGSGVSLEKLYYGNKVDETPDQNGSNTYSFHFVTSAPQPVYGQPDPDPVTVNSPIPLEDGEALLEFKEGGVAKYFKIKDIERISNAPTGGGWNFGN